MGRKVADSRARLGKDVAHGPVASATWQVPVGRFPSGMGGEFYGGGSLIKGRRNAREPVRKLPSLILNLHQILLSEVSDSV
jgi:hypothetical protein